MNTASISLPPRFHEPLNTETMAELLAYQELLNIEVRRVANVLNSWPADGVIHRAALTRKTALREIPRSTSRFNMKSV